MISLDLIQRLRDESDKYVDENMDIAIILNEAADELESVNIVLNDLKDEGIHISIGSV